MTSEVYVGRVRSVVTHSVISLFTIIYFFVWFTQINAEVRRHRNGGPHPAVLLILFILLPVVGWFVIAFIAAVQVRRLQREVDADKLTSPWFPALWSLVPVVGWTISAGILQTGANSAWMRIHRQWSQTTSGPVTLECPQCSNRFDLAIHPFGPTSVVCPTCGRTGAV